MIWVVLNLVEHLLGLQWYGTISALDAQDNILMFLATDNKLSIQDGSKALFKGNPGSASRDALLKAHKNHRGPSKRIVWDHATVPLTNNKLLRQLCDFIQQFLSGGYNGTFHDFMEFQIVFYFFTSLCVMVVFLLGFDAISFDAVNTRGYRERTSCSSKQ